MPTAAGAPPPLSLALVGLPRNYLPLPPEIQSTLEKGLAAVQTQMADAGIQYELYAVSPEEGLAELGPKLQSQRPDVVVIGNGIRRTMEFTPVMEQIIDIVRASAPQAKLAFNTSPDTTMDAVKRWFPSGAK